MTGDKLILPAKSKRTEMLSAAAALFPRAPPSFKNLTFLSPSKPSVLSLSTAADAAATSKTYATLSARAPRPGPSDDEEERVFFDGGAHYGDLVANLALGLTLLWLPLTLAAVSRAFFLRYRFTDKRVTVVSGLAGQDRADFPYSAVADVKVVPRFVGEWGDLVITLTDGTKVDLRSVPKFREIADYCRGFMADPPAGNNTRPRGF